MRTLILIITILFSTNSFTQTLSIDPTRDDFIGTWEWENSNQIFRVEIFEAPSYYGTTLNGHYKMVEVDNNGNETELYNSNRPIYPGSAMNFPPPIEGGSLIAFNSVRFYKFFFQDCTATVDNPAPPLGELRLKFIPTEQGEPLKISWNLLVEGLANEGQAFSVPTNMTLTKVE
jgi:hypothetical protein